MRAAFHSRACAPALCVLALALSGCGGGSAKTVTAASAPQSTPGTGTQTAAAPTKTATAPAAPAATTGGSTTRTAPGPAFAEEHQAAQGAGAQAAAALVRAKGYTPNNTAEYHSNQTLQVLTATRTGSSGAYAQQAFFFLDGRYLGTDAKEPSGQLKVLAQSDTEVAIAYPLYRPGDSPCCPGGGTRVVHFALNNGKLTALDPIPPASSASGLSRN
ncbi:MAG: LppP/LprE family lipoprotein [Solirubrobacteraceae bacterium]